MSAATRLHERSGELAQLAAALDAAVAGDGSTVVVEGAAGIGKTSLLTAVREQARAAGARTLSARASELESRFPFGMVHQLLDRAVFAMGASERDAAFTGAARLAAEVFGEGATSASADDLYPTLHGLYWLCAHLAADSPLVILFDDAQWADEPSLSFVQFLARRIEELPILLVVGTRPAHAERSPLLSPIVTDPAATVLRPAPLSDGVVGEWVRTVVDADADPAFAHACHTATGGNPFLLTELLREVGAARLEPTAAAAHRVGALAPGGVSAVVTRRLATMPSGTVAFARAVAVLGDGTSQGLAAALAGMDEETAAEAAAALCRAEMLEDRSGLAFAHPVIRTTVYSALTPGERSAGHAQAARLLAARGAGADAQAAHLLATDPCGDAAAVETLRSAAARAGALGAPRSAVTYLERALLEPPSEAVRPQLLIELGRAETRAGGPEAIRHLEEALVLASDETTRARAGLELARRLKYGGRAVQAVEILEQRLAHAEALDPALAEQIEVELVSSGYLSVGARERLAPRLSQQVDPGVPPRTMLEAWTIAALAFDESAAGTDAARAAELATRAMAGELIPDEVTACGYGRLMSGVGAMWADRFDHAATVFATMLDGARRRGSGVAFSAAHSMSALNNWRLGALADAEADATASLELASEMAGAETFRSAAQAIQALVAMERGLPDDELRRLRDAMAPALHDTDSLPYHLVHHARGSLSVALGELRVGLEDLLAGMRREHEWGALCPAPSGCRAAASLAHTALGEREEALALADEDVRRARAFGAPRALGMALHAQALARGGSEAIAGLGESVAVLETSRARVELTRALVDLGGALRRSGQRTEARATLRRALELAVRCGAVRLADRAREEMLASGARPRRVALSGVEALTPSERRVAELAADGLTNREVAQALFVTIKTVENHLARVFAKLDVTARGQLPQALAASAGSVGIAV